MNRHFEAVKVTDRVYWVGAIDWGIRDFHGYSTLRGSTYNAYLIMADDVILIDTVREPFKEELLARVASLTDPKNIKYIISNHSEPDHSSGLPWMIEQVKPEKVFASKMGLKDLDGYYHRGGFTQVDNNSTLTLGGVDLTFIDTPMIHWPDSMMTYMPSDKLLFSQDGFGMHLASSERFTDEIPQGVLYEENAKYFANILLPYKQLIVKLLDKIKELGLAIETICPDHGPIWRKNLQVPLNTYRKWCAQEPTNKAVITYDTMWGSTGIMARAIEDGMEGAGASVVVLPMKSSDRSAVVTEVLEAGALLVGSPTLNSGMFPTMADTLTYMKGLKPKNLVGAAFGSFGWSGEAAGQLNEFLEQMKIEVVSEPLNLRFVPDAEGIEACRRFGEAVAKRLKEVVQNGA